MGAIGFGPPVHGSVASQTFIIWLTTAADAEIHMQL